MATSRKPRRSRKPLRRSRKPLRRSKRKSRKKKEKPKFSFIKKTTERGQRCGVINNTEFICNDDTENICENGICVYKPYKRVNGKKCRNREGIMLSEDLDDIKKEDLFIDNQYCFTREELIDYVKSYNYTTRPITNPITRQELDLNKLREFLANDLNIKNKRGIWDINSLEDLWARIREAESRDDYISSSESDDNDWDEIQRLRIEENQDDDGSSYISDDSNEFWR